MPIIDSFYFDTADMIELAVELAIVLICSGAIGFERELKNRPAGLRTHMIVATTAMLIMHIGGNLAEGTNGAADPGRMAAQVVSGIGFLGAGTILRGKAKDEVHGLTTAATLWVVSAVGISIGAGYIWEGIVTTVAILIILSIVSRWEKRYNFRRSESFCLEIKTPFDNIELLQTILESNHLSLGDYAIQGYHEDEDQWFHLHIRIEYKPKQRVRLPRKPLPELLASFSFIRNIEADHKMR